MGPEKKYGAHLQPEVTYSSDTRYLPNHMEVLSLGIHPAYWRNRCGHDLASWCVALADTDRIPLVSSCAPMGAKVCKGLGFTEQELVIIKGYKHHVGDVTLSFQQRSGPEKTIAAYHFRRRDSKSFERTLPMQCEPGACQLQRSDKRGRTYDVIAKEDTVVVLFWVWWSIDFTQ